MYWENEEFSRSNYWRPLVNNNYEFSITELEKQSYAGVIIVCL